MSGDIEKKASAERTSGRLIDVEVEVPVDEMMSRHAETFVPEQDDALDEAPESITAGELLPNVAAYSGISLDALPVRGLKLFVYAFGALLISLVAWEAASVFQSALDLHWALAGAYAIVILAVCVLGMRLVWFFLYDSNNMAALQDIRIHAQRLDEGLDFGNAKHLVTEMHDFYAGKPHAIHFQRCIDQLADYSDDREVVSHIARVFLEPLDEEALRRVTKYSLETGVAVSISPWASLDMVLALWRNMKMIDDVAQVYGMRPSLRNRNKLLKSVLNQLVMVGASHLLLDSSMEDFGTFSLAEKVSARLGQGLGAGIYTGKIGTAAIIAARPIEFTSGKQPRLQSVVGELVDELRRRFRQERER